MFIETKANEEKDTPGWIKKTKAEYLFYADIEHKKLFVMRMEDVKDYIRRHKCPVKKTYKDGYKVSVGLIVSVDEMKKEYTVKEIECFKRS